MTAAPLLDLIDMRKSFGAIEALRGVTFSVAAGEVVALLGDNGAGKSTLVKIIAGEMRPTSGRIVFDGAERQFGSQADAKAAGIETVYQDLSLCANLDVVSNFFMGRELTRKVLGVPILREREMEAETARALSAGGTSIPSLRGLVERLSGGQRQAIELNRFVHWGGKFVMLDEPFAALGVEQTRRGLQTVERVRAQGIGVMLITHVMAQAFSIADRIVVMRHGVVAGDLRVEDTTPDEVVRLITGDIERTGSEQGSIRRGDTRMNMLGRMGRGGALAVGDARRDDGDAAAQTKGQIYYLVPTLIDEFQTGSIDAITKFMGEVGYEVVSLDAQNRSDLQLNQVDDVLNLAPCGGDDRGGGLRRDQAGHREAARRGRAGDDLRPADHLDAERLHLGRGHRRDRPYRRRGGDPAARRRSTARSRARCCRILGDPGDPYTLEIQQGFEETMAAHPDVRRS